MMSKKCLFLLGLITFFITTDATGGDTRWKLISVSDDQILDCISREYIDTKSILGNPKGIIRVWTKTIFEPKNPKDPSSGLMEEAKFLSEVDCSGRRTRLLQSSMKLRDGTLRYGDIEHNTDGLYGQWQDVMPDTPNERFFESVCREARKVKHKGKRK